MIARLILMFAMVTAPSFLSTALFAAGEAGPADALAVPTGKRPLQQRLSGIEVDQAIQAIEDAGAASAVVPSWDAAGSAPTSADEESEGEEIPDPLGQDGQDGEELPEVYAQEAVYEGLAGIPLSVPEPTRLDKLLYDFSRRQAAKDPKWAAFGDVFLKIANNGEVDDEFDDVREAINKMVCEIFGSIPNAFDTALGEISQSLAKSSSTAAAGSAHRSPGVKKGPGQVGKRSGKDMRRLRKLEGKREATSGRPQRHAKRPARYRND